MTDKENTKKGTLSTILITGLVSLAVGIGSGLLINYFTEKRPKLTYDITTQEVFTGQINNIGIFAFRVSNDGKQEIEKLLCHLKFSEGKITERRVGGVPVSARTVVGSDDEIEVSVPFLNPNEHFSVQVLLGNVKQPLVRPSIEIRGKGVIGKEIVSSKSSKKSFSEIFPLLSVALVTLLTALITLKSLMDRRLKNLSEMLDEKEEPTKHASGDQRDTIAFALDTKALYEDAKMIREWPRELPYWAASDSLCNKWLISKDHDRIKKGIESLDFLVDYAEIADASKRIIFLNMAKLAFAVDNLDLSKKYLSDALLEQDDFIKKRIQADTTLSSIYTTKV